MNVFQFWDIDCQVRQAGPSDCTINCGTVTVNEVIEDQSGNGKACVDTTYSCQPGDGQCPKGIPFQTFSCVLIYELPIWISLEFLVNTFD